MSRIRENAVPAVVALLVLVLGVGMWLLLDDARSSGLRTLQSTRADEVTAVARSQNQSVASSLSGTGGLAQQPWEIELESEVDLGLMNDLLQFLPPDFETGFFVTDPTGIVTQGVLLESDDSIGEAYERAGLNDLLGSPTFSQGVGGILPMASGITTAKPTTASVFPILSPQTGALRGTFIFESTVDAESTFNTELAPLQRGTTGAYLFIDSNGAVIGSSDPGRIATVVEDQRLLTDAEGFYQRDGRLVMIQDVPAAGWRLIFEQDRSEFEAGLAGPLQDVGRLLLVVSFVTAFVLFVVLVRRLDAAREEQRRLTELATKQEEFISIVSHELRTPVSGVLGFLQTSIDHWEEISPEERLSAVRRAASNARRLQGLTRDVLDSQTIERGSLSYSFAAVDVRDEVTAAIEAASDAYPERKIDVTMFDDPTLVNLDVDRFQQVLTNLIDNAHKNSSLTAAIEVNVTKENGNVLLSVADRGAGLGEELLATLFDKFVRGRGSGPTGTGLGLYIAKQIVLAHEGDIVVRNRDGGGAEFSVRLPVLVGSPNP